MEPLVRRRDPRTGLAGPGTPADTPSGLHSRRSHSSRPALQQEQLLPGSPSPSPPSSTSPSGATSPAPGATTPSGSIPPATAGKNARKSSVPPVGASRLPYPSRIDAHFFPVHDFALDPPQPARPSSKRTGRKRAQAAEEGEGGGPLPLSELAFQRGQVPPGGRAESPPDGPLRHVSIPPDARALRGATATTEGGSEEDEDEDEDGGEEEEEEEGPTQTSSRRGKRARSSAVSTSTTATVPSPRRGRGGAAAANASPRKRARGAAAAAGGGHGRGSAAGGKAAAQASADESELSDLSSDNEHDSDGSDEAAAGEGDEGASGSRKRGREEPAPATSDAETVADDDDEDFAPRTGALAASNSAGGQLPCRPRAHLNVRSLSATKKATGRRSATAAAAASHSTPDLPSRSASPGAAAAGGSNSASSTKTTRAGAATRAKAEREKSEALAAAAAATTPRSSARRAGAGANKVRFGARETVHDLSWRARRGRGLTVVFLSLSAAALIGSRGWLVDKEGDPPCNISPHRDRWGAPGDDVCTRARPSGPLVPRESCSHPHAQKARLRPAWDGGLATKYLVQQQYQSHLRPLLQRRPPFRSDHPRLVDPPALVRPVLPIDHEGALVLRPVGRQVARVLERHRFRHGVMVQARDLCRCRMRGKGPRSRLRQIGGTAQAQILLRQDLRSSHAGSGTIWRVQGNHQPPSATQ